MNKMVNVQVVPLLFTYSSFLGKFRASPTLLSLSPPHALSSLDTRI